mmetsp:Transcript_24175/g.82522  ORF Transcript_24175/g.82522 Transcript_24175/m.82522 type:complete len:403 (-) Transcript_24175:3195-4403(-)
MLGQLRRVRVQHLLALHHEVVGHAHEVRRLVRPRAPRAVAHVVRAAVLRDESDVREELVLGLVPVLHALVVHRAQVHGGAHEVHVVGHHLEGHGRAEDLEDAAPGLLVEHEALRDRRQEAVELALGAARAGGLGALPSRPTRTALAQHEPEALALAHVGRLGLVLCGLALVLILVLLLGRLLEVLVLVRVGIARAALAPAAEARSTAAWLARPRGARGARPAAAARREAAVAGALGAPGALLLAPPLLALLCEPLLLTGAHELHRLEPRAPLDRLRVVSHVHHGQRGVLRVLARLLRLVVRLQDLRVLHDLDGPGGRAVGVAHGARHLQPGAAPLGLLVLVQELAEVLQSPVLVLVVQLRLLLLLRLGVVLLLAERLFQVVCKGVGVALLLTVAVLVAVRVP